MNDDLEDRTDALDQVFHYHDSTKHHYQRYAPGPGYLDWATQPNPFRRYTGARLLGLERPPVTNEPLYDEAYVQDRVSPARVTRQTISQLFYDSLALSAWKSTGEARWALRVNPSSGNLHPTEGLPDLRTHRRPLRRAHGVSLRSEGACVGGASAV